METIMNLVDSLFDGNEFLFCLEFLCEADQITLLGSYLAPNVMPDEVFQAYKMLGNYGITRLVTLDAMHRKICRCTKVVRGVMGKSHKWAHILTACKLSNCDHTGRSLKAMCVAGVQNNDQRGRSFAGTSITNRELDEQNIF